MNTFVKIAITIAFSLFSYLLTQYFLSSDSEYCAAQKKFQLLPLGLFYAAAAVILFYFRQNVDTAQFLLDNCFVFMLLSVAIIDLLSQYIYDAMLLLYSIGNLVLVIWLNGLHFKNGYGIITGALFYGIIYLVSRLIYRREAFGLGDVLFLAAIGVVLDATSTFAVGLLAFYVAIMHLLIQLFINRALGRQDELAFAPSIAVAGLLLYFFKAPLLQIYFSIIG